MVRALDFSGVDLTGGLSQPGVGTAQYLMRLGDDQNGALFGCISISVSLSGCAQNDVLCSDIIIRTHWRWRRWVTGLFEVMKPTAKALLSLLRPSTVDSLTRVKTPLR